jgi:phytoene/squalene synthetase
MKSLYDKVSTQISTYITKEYSTSFSWGIKMLDVKYRDAIYSIYGFVRVADEIVDSFESYNKKKLLKKFKKDTFLAISDGISTNPVLNSFQNVVNTYQIDLKLIETFLDSMEMDLKMSKYDEKSLKKYILGSAEVVGLMCLKVFVDGDQKEYNNLSELAKTLGSAFQKINFLRDLNEDYQKLGRVYFPNVDLDKFTNKKKKKIESDLENEFDMALYGVMLLPKNVKLGVYVAYRYYYTLFNKIKSTDSSKLMSKRIRINNLHKMWIIIKSYFEFLLFM